MKNNMTRDYLYGICNAEFNAWLATGRETGYLDLDLLLNHSQDCQTTLMYVDVARDRSVELEDIKPGLYREVLANLNVLYQRQSMMKPKTDQGREQQ